MISSSTSKDLTQKKKNVPHLRHALWNATNDVIVRGKYLVDPFNL